MSPSRVEVYYTQAYNVNMGPGEFLLHVVVLAHTHRKVYAKKIKNTGLIPSNKFEIDVQENILAAAALCP